MEYWERKLDRREPRQVASGRREQVLAAKEHKMPEIIGLCFVKWFAY
jgi:hypothetical protein